MTDSTATGRTRLFRFGVVAPLTTDLPTWRDRVRRIADSGYSTLLMPDVPQWQPAPGPTLAVAAALGSPLSSRWLSRLDQCAPVLAAVKQGALDGGCGPALVMGAGTGLGNGQALVA